MSGATDALEAAYEAASDGGKAKKALVRTLGKALNALMVQFVAYVQEVSGGDETIILSTGLLVEAAKTPPQTLGAPQNLLVKTGVMEGDIKPKWDKLTGSVLYFIETNLDGNTNWIDAGNSTRANTTLS